MTDQNPLVSVIIPCYNAQQFIADTIHSVLNQTYTNFELIIIDDGSSDNSALIIKTFSDERIRYFLIQNHGVAHARNLGISMAKGKYISFLDADDLFLPQNLSSKIAFLEQQSNFNIVHSAAIFFESSTGITLNITKGLGGKVLNALLELSKSVVNSPSSLVISKSLLQQHPKGFDENLGTSADWEFWVRLAKDNDFGYLDEALIKYRIHDGQMHKNIPLMDKEMNYAFLKVKGVGAFYSEKYFNTCYAKLCLILGLSYLKYNSKLKGVVYIIKSIGLNPTIVFKYLWNHFTVK
jgi:glycosyltransferase involved in cell wall biosynthesis